MDKSSETEINDLVQKKYETVSYKTDLWDGFESVCLKVEAGRKLLEQLIGLLTDRAQYEDDNAANLEKMAKRWLSSQATNQEGASVSRAVGAVRMELLKNAEQARGFSEAIRDDVIAQLSTTAKNHSTLLKRIHTDGLRFYRQFQSHVTDLDRAAAHYIKLSKEAMDLSSQSMGVVEFLSSPSTPASTDVNNENETNSEVTASFIPPSFLSQPILRSKAAVNAIGVCREAQLAEEQYQNAVQSYNAARVLYLQQLSAILSTLQDIDEKRILCFKDALRKLHVYSMGMVRNAQYDLDTTIEAVEEVDFRLEIINFVKLKKSGIDPLTAELPQHWSELIKPGTGKYSYLLPAGALPKIKVAESSKQSKSKESSPARSKEQLTEDENNLLMDEDTKNIDHALPETMSAISISEEININQQGQAMNVVEEIANNAPTDSQDDLPSSTTTTNNNNTNNSNNNNNTSVGFSEFSPLAPSFDETPSASNTNNTSAANAGGFSLSKLWGSTLKSPFFAISGGASSILTASGVLSKNSSSVNSTHLLNNNTNTLTAATNNQSNSTNKNPTSSNVITVSNMFLPSLNLSGGTSNAQTLAQQQARAWVEAVESSYEIISQIWAGKPVNESFSPVENFSSPAYRWAFCLSLHDRRLRKQCILPTRASLRQLVILVRVLLSAALAAKDAWCVRAIVILSQHVRCEKRTEQVNNLVEAIDGEEVVLLTKYMSELLYDHDVFNSVGMWEDILRLSIAADLLKTQLNKHWATLSQAEAEAAERKFKAADPGYGCLMTLAHAMTTFGITAADVKNVVLRVTLSLHLDVSYGENLLICIADSLTTKKELQQQDFQKEQQQITLDQQQQKNEEHPQDQSVEESINVNLSDNTTISMNNDTTFINATATDDNFHLGPTNDEVFIENDLPSTSVTPKNSENKIEFIPMDLNDDDDDNNDDDNDNGGYDTMDSEKDNFGSLRSDDNKNINPTFGRENNTVSGVNSLFEGVLETDQPSFDILNQLDAEALSDEDEIHSALDTEHKNDTNNDVDLYFSSPKQSSKSTEHALTPQNAVSSGINLLDL